MNIQKLRTQLQNTKDKLGKTIDEKIFDTILYLNAHGLNTSASCEGHLDRGLAFPWVDFSSSDEKKKENLNNVSDELRGLLVETKNNYNNKDVISKKRQQDEILAEISQNNYEQIKKLIDLLGAFYKSRKTTADMRLIVIDRATDFRLQPQGGILQKNRPENEREEYLIKYQKELSAFTLFVKGHVERKD